MKKSFTQRALHSLVSGTVFGLALMVTISVVAYAQGNAQPIFQSMLEGMLVNPNPATTDWQVVNARDADHALTADSVDLSPLKIINGNVAIGTDAPISKLDVSGDVNVNGVLNAKNLKLTGSSVNVGASGENDGGDCESCWGAKSTWEKTCPDNKVLVGLRQDRNGDYTGVTLICR